MKTPDDGDESRWARKMSETDGGEEKKSAPRGAEEAKVEAGEDPTLSHLKEGFRINWMSMSDGVTKEELWRDDDWTAFHDSTEVQEKEAVIPARILDCSVVAREICFSSDQVIEGFRIEQRIMYKTACIEQWVFDFGFVMPESTNTWQQTIVAAEKSKMLPAEVISGEIVVHTFFYSGERVFATSHVRIFYE